MIEYILAFLLAYFIGNFSSAYLIGKLFFSLDIREHGSGNAGATNALRVLGKKVGIATLFLDIFKGIISLYLVSRLFGDKYIYIAGLAAVLGHNWPIVFSFKGGKGIATSCGVLLYLDWRLVLFLFISFLIIVLIFRYVSLASISCSFLAILYSIFFYLNKNIDLAILVMIMGALAIYRHKSNINRLLNGEENRLSFSKRGA